jgi:predicted ATPase with chaperone activity
MTLMVSPHLLLEADCPDEALLVRPSRVEDTGLSFDLLLELVVKHLHTKGVQTQGDLASGLALSSAIIATLIAQLKRQASIEVFTAVDQNGLRYALTDKGRVGALEAMTRSGYTGPAPITLEHYEALCLAQSVHKHQVTMSAMHAAFADTVIPRDLLDQLGSAVHSARPIFVYGLPGTGKTFITQRVSRLLGEAVYVPYAVAVGEEIFQLFDPAFHHTLERPAEAASEDDILHLQRGHDPRLVLCRRPFVMSGGELTMAGLEIGVDQRARLQSAPLQLKASNGIYLIDDLGRQRMPVTELLNRWIVPMESKQDYLTLGSGKRFQVPFDLILIFSTNLEPRDLADDAFLRRIGHKIHFKPMPETEYRHIWHDMLAARELQAEPGALDYLIEELHAKHGVPLLPSHPRDLSGMIRDRVRYTGDAPIVTPAHMRDAWENFFVSFDRDTGPQE